MSAPDRVVFGAEPLIAHADDELGSEVVEEYLDAVAVEDTVGYASYVNFAEIRYTIARKYDRDTADEYLDWLTNLGIKTVDVADTWTDASEYTLKYNPTLGDSFALATAEHVDATLFVGGDDDYDDVSDIPIERFRDGSA
ncbi:PIN domain-containing protein [Halorubrum ezzemoulense]|uniref:PIN domain-containing protein n=1 Tax=Halorubrum TaxID=56688 RepID=UPI0010FA5B7E|nr:MULTISPECIES: PIN domain-containing protein [Halorubrum]MDB2262423.1 PIN domain-containing protein [Halorubrum ezzemoulense]MDB2269209.1 PIN domain-containing protein [Halorubrum ezzemoulense]MDB9281291.1 PIN domain-containing protein [Halorubrum ezzemoulense]MDB9284712.1 PIN domain-containing protein [Halorubrum ezzemoulense]TKX37210.1 type II toxin-antitoxin system VapC family toxin [Halorubrum sp. CGM4_25_10-8A]